jgi:integrase
VTVDAENEKAGRGATLTHHPFVVEKLVGWLTTRRQRSVESEKVAADDEPLWPGSWSNKAAEMLRLDLDEARVIWLAEVEKFTSDHGFRQKSNILKLMNTKGEVADFHALRHTFITMLSSSGVHPKIAQQLARHSTITLTMDRYSHAKASRPEIRRREPADAVTAKEVGDDRHNSQL